MMRFFPLGLLLVLTAAIFPAHAQTLITLEGQLIQGTANGTPLTANLPLRLDILTPEGELRESYTTTSEAENKFYFPSVPQYTDGSLYVVYATWAGLEQSSLPVVLESEVQPIEFPLYETTTGLNDVVLYEGNLRVEFEETNTVGVQMLLEMRYTNLGDQIILPDGENGTFTVELPVGALGIAPEEAVGAVQRFEAVNQVGGLPIPGIRDTQPLVPNWPNTLRVSFFVPYSLGAVIDMRFPFSVDNMRLYVREDTVYVEGELFGLTDETVTTTGRVYQIYEQTQALEPGDPFKFSLVGQPTETVRRPQNTDDSSDSSTTLLILVVVLAAGIITVMLVAWLFYARKAAT